MEKVWTGFGDGKESHLTSSLGKVMMKSDENDEDEGREKVGPFYNPFKKIIKKGEEEAFEESEGNVEDTEKGTTINSIYYSENDGLITVNEKSAWVRKHYHVNVNNVLLLFQNLSVISQTIWLHRLYRDKNQQAIS